MAWSGEWVRLAACRALDEPDRLFVQGAAQHDAKTVCMGCPVRLECLAEALDARIEWGVWGGMTERERRAVLRRRPQVTSWRRLLEAARAEYERVGGVVEARSAGAPSDSTTATIRSTTGLTTADEPVRVAS